MPHHLMHHIAHLLHPSQTVMSYFKEPQRAVAEIQRILDGDHPACALLADLSKAFERLTRTGLCTFFAFVVLHGGFLPMLALCFFTDRLCTKCRTIRQGVDMGWSFSVYLFCFAMDPRFHYLNRIPGVISVQAYVDDTTIAGIAGDPRWLHEVELLLQVSMSIATAAFGRVSMTT